ncbi:MAG TPA: CDP-alcohol phosphatidyltransferase family protein [Polyangia bacterium]
MRTRFLVPNLFTGLNFLLGVTAILLMQEGSTAARAEPGITWAGKAPLVLAGWIIIWCTLLDKLDGVSARLLKATSAFGAQFDSMADLTAFGIAPGLLTYFYTQSLDPSWFASNRASVMAASSIYMLCAAIRLARFNAVDSANLTRFIQGLPSPFAGGIVVLAIILHAKHLPGQAGPGSIFFFPALLIALGLLMVSPLYLPKLGRRENRMANAFQMVNVLLGYVCGFAMIFPEYLLGLLLAYASVGFSWGVVNRGRLELPHTEGQPAHPE